MGYGALRIPEWAWRQPDVRRALAERDAPALLRHAQQYTGASQATVAAAVGMGQGRVNEIIHGRRTVAHLEVLERIADGLSMPDDARQTLGLAPRESFAPEVVRVYPSQADAAPDIRRAVAAARAIDVLAVRGLGLLGLNDSLLRAAVSGRPECRVRVLLVHPDSPAAEQRAAEVGESAEAMAAGIRLATGRLAELATTVRVEAYWYRVLPVWRMISADEAVFVSVFDTANEGHEAAMYQLVPAPAGVLYRGYRRMFEALRSGADRVV